MKPLKKNFDLIFLTLIIAAFLYVALPKLGSVPLPDTDESMTLQVPYEMVNRGKLAFPMYRYLGGNIENVWHSYTPAFFVMLASFQKFFGWGLLQGRVFNVLCACLILVLVHLIGRKLFDWRAGVAAALVLIADPTFVDRSRIVRNDYPAAMFGLLSFYLYELSRVRRSGWLVASAGFAAGAGVMCHTNLLYALALVPAVMVAGEGLRVLKTRRPYLFAAGALIAMSYEIVYDLVDHQNFVLQNREDPLHFQVLNQLGWWANFKAEAGRYVDWHNGFLKVDSSLTLLHIFQYLAIVAVVYCLVLLAIAIRRRTTPVDSRLRVFLAVVVIVSFFAFVTQRKIIQYIIHISPWLALLVGILIADASVLIRRIAEWRSQYSRPIYVTLLIVLAGGGLWFSAALAKQDRVHLKSLRDPDRASFDEIKSAFRAAVPDELCPVAVGSGVLWLAFPERDECFATIERRMKDSVDIDGKPYALIVQHKRSRKERKLVEHLTRNASLIAEVTGTAYGSFQVYYTGQDGRFSLREPRRFTLFGARRGLVTDEQLNSAREIWTRSGDQLNGLSDAEHQFDSAGVVIRPDERKNGEVTLCSLDLEPMSIYQIRIDNSLESGRWALSLVEEESGAVIYRGRISSEPRGRAFADVFRSLNGGRVKIIVNPIDNRAAAPLTITRVSLSEVAKLTR